MVFKVTKVVKIPVIKINKREQDTEDLLFLLWRISEESEKSKQMLTNVPTCAYLSVRKNQRNKKIITKKKNRKKLGFKKLFICFTTRAYILLNRNQRRQESENTFHFLIPVFHSKIIIQITRLVSIEISNKIKIYPWHARSFLNRNGGGVDWGGAEQK